MNRANYIFVDFENIQEVDLALVAGKSVTVFFILGERHRTLPVELVNQLLAHAGQVRVIRTGQAGKNALDFVLACELGRQTALDAEGYFHILSKDKGFDALVVHLKAQGVHASRHELFGRIPVLAKVPALALAERVARVQERLACNPASRPKREKSLRGLVRGTFAGQLTVEEEEETLGALVSGGILELAPDGQVRYLLPEQAAD